MALIIRPPITVLPETAQVPDRNLLMPPPNVFTHELLANCPYYYNEPRPGQAPAGELARGTRLLLLRTESQACWVADASGLYVVLPQAASHMMHIV